jgi:hypothetical protein
VFESFTVFAGSVQTELINTKLLYGSETQIIKTKGINRFQATEMKQDVKPLKPKLVKIIFKNSVRTSKRTPHFTITKINWLTAV